jgi:SAM-dependent methyltransferase
MKKPEPIALNAFEELAEAYAARVDTKAHNAYFERPATLSLLPDVAGKRVLDAGCGPGAYAEWLVEHEAEVFSIDVSPKMVQKAQERLGDRARVICADLSQPLDFLEDGSFDIVLSALTLDYIEDWGKVFNEFFRVLRVLGVLVFSAGHPAADFNFRDMESYFETELLQQTWRGFGKPVVVPNYRRPLGAMLNPLVETGFSIDHILEPQPLEQFKEQDPEDYERLLKRPNFTCFRAVKQ